MKKARLLMSLALIALMVGLFTMPAFAAPNLPADNDVVYWDIRGDSSQDSTGNGPDGTDLIPVYGYIGETTTLTDTDPDDPEVGPTPVENEINVSVPIKIIWAAFETDGGDITAPNYHIRNNSMTESVSIDLMSFSKNDTADNNAVDSDVTLALLEGQSTLLSDVLTLSGQPTIVTNLAVGTQWDFTLGGRYEGSFATAYNPSYLMYLKFYKGA
jgi:hypothetical protein